MRHRQRHIQKKMPKRKAKKPFYKKAVFWYSLLFFAIIGGAAYFLLFFPNFQIQKIYVSGAERTSADNIKNIAAKAATKNFVSIGNWTLSSESIFLAKTAEIEKEILNSDAVIDSAVIAKKWPDGLEIKIKEREQIAIFCQQNHCFEIDANGVIFDQTANSLPADIIVRQNQLIENLAVGEPVVHKNIMAAIYEIEKNLKENFKIDIAQALISTPIRLNITTSEGWDIYFDTGEDSNLSSQITKLNLLLKQEMSPEARKNLEYIDLRFKDRAYYK